MVEEIKEIIENCESVQESQESAYTKEQAKKWAYERIKEIVMGKITMGLNSAEITLAGYIAQRIVEELKTTEHDKRGKI